MAGDRAERRPKIKPTAARRPRWRWVALGGGAAIVVTAVGVALLATVRPAWYRPLAIDYTRLHDDKVALAGLEEQISAALNTAATTRVRLGEDQINRWLAARAEIWPGGDVDVGPLADPVVQVTADGFQVGGVVQVGGWQAVASASIRARLTNDELRLRVERARVGALGMPERWLWNSLGPALAGRGVFDSATGEFVVPNEWTWPNGKRRCRLRALEFTAGALEAVVEPAGGERTAPLRPPE